MSDEHINIMLNAGDFGGLIWSAPPDNKSWSDKFQQLKQYKSKHGHCKVPAVYRTNQLGRWVRYQRVLYKKTLKGLDTPLTKERIELLESIGFVWSVRLPTSKESTKEKETLEVALGNCESEQNHKPISIEASHQDSKEKETKTAEKVEKSCKRSLQDKVQDLCKLSIMFQEQKNAMYADMKRRKLDNSAQDRMDQKE